MPRPDIRQVTKYIDLDKPRVHVYGQSSTGSSNLVDSSVTTGKLADGAANTAKAALELFFGAGTVDGGVAGITDAMQVWADKNLDGGVL